ncbi:trigger factor [Vallicoccus soli]|uniref:Trigger factor n=1 Tax=Vallicoccus soli TaxID=2339232 RepID=A0A3A3Z306_9ACTN|nr:trigger factor [Vallicoccus soli]RJK97089.1 trigger factor [Vallicoccus soli]
MKSALETLNPTRVKLTVEVPFDELKPSLDAAYKKIASQVQIPGFRRGKVPPRLIDQRFGRGAVLEEAVNEALPRFYGDAVRENDVAIVGQPEVEVTELNDGEQLTFTAEVDVVPTFEVPEYEGLEVSVDDVEVTDADVDEALQSLRERFGTLTGVDRPAQEGDFLSIDLVAKVGDEEVDSVSGMSYQVGSTNMLDGLDEAVRGLSAGEQRTFTTELAGGEHAGETADVTVTVASVKERELPELDDEFAQTASEFDTVEELRADARTRVERQKALEQGVQARDRALEALLAKVDVPLPETLVKAEVDGRMHNLAHQLEAAGMTKEQYLQGEERTEEDFDAEVEQRARESIKAQFVLDKIAAEQQLQPSEAEVTEHLVRSAQRYGMQPQDFVNQIVQGGQVQSLISEVVRGKALAAVLEAARVTDASGRTVDLEALREPGEDEDAGPAEVGEGVVDAAEGVEGEGAEDQPLEDGATAEDVEAAPRS